MRSIVLILALVLLVGGGCAKREDAVQPAGSTPGGTAAATEAPAASVTTTDAVVDPDVAKLVVEEPVAVSITDSGITITGSPAPGATQFQVTNNGTKPHTLAIEGGGVNARLDAPLAPQQINSLTVDLAPGTYRLFCPDEPDALSAELTVAEPPALAAP